MSEKGTTKPPICKVCRAGELQTARMPLTSQHGTAIGIGVFLAGVAVAILTLWLALPSDCHVVYRERFGLSQPVPMVMDVRAIAAALVSFVVVGLGGALTFTRKALLCPNCGTISPLSSQPPLPHDHDRQEIHEHG